MCHDPHYICDNIDIYIYIYSKQTFGQKAADTGKAAGEIAAENLATSVATTAVTNCCVVV